MPKQCLPVAAAMAQLVHPSDWIETALFSKDVRDDVTSLKKIFIWSFLSLNKAFVKVRSEVILLK